MLTELLQDKDLSEVSVGPRLSASRKTRRSERIEKSSFKLSDAERLDETARKRYVEALKRGIGGAGLVYALKVVHSMSRISSPRGRFILEELRELASSAAAACKRYLKDKTEPALWALALALADVGDVETNPTSRNADAGRSKAASANLGCDVNRRSMPTP